MKLIEIPIRPKIPDVVLAVVGIAVVVIVFVVVAVVVVVFVVVVVVVVSNYSSSKINYSAKVAYDSGLRNPCVLKETFVTAMRENTFY